MLLTLPTLDPCIPKSFRTGTLGVRQLKMMLAMSRLGLLTDDDLAGINAATVDAGIVMATLEAAWLRAVGDVYEYKLNSAYATLIFPDLGELDVHEENSVSLYAGVVYQSSQPEWIAGGKVFEALEEAHKGLGKTVISEIDSVLSRFGCPHTINGVLDMCSRTEWMGEENEKVMLEEYADEVNTDDVVRFVDVVEGVPEWAYKPDPDFKYLTSDQLDRQVKRLGNNPLGKLVEVIARLARLLNAQPMFSELEQDYEPLDPPVVIGWNFPEQFDQYIDNYHHYQMEGESAPWSGAIRFEITESGISTALSHIRHTGSVLKALDEAIILIRDFNQ